MDFCAVNWGYIKDIIVALISAGIPSFVACKIYKKWKVQKSSEVIACEAKNIFYDVCEHRKHLDYLLNYEISNKQAMISFNHLDDLIIKINDQISFLCENITNIKHKKSLETYQRSISKLHHYIDRIMERYDDKNLLNSIVEVRESLEKNLDKPDSYFKNYKHSLTNVKLVLSEISLYNF
jgi:hypothetical protein